MSASHLGPVSISSLGLSEFFDCLRNYTDLNRTVGYTTGVVSVKVNISLDERGVFLSMWSNNVVLIMSSD